MVPESVQIGLQGVFRFGGGFSSALEMRGGGCGIDGTWWAFDDVGPACRVGDLPSFTMLGWWFLAAGHGVWLAGTKVGIFNETECKERCKANGILT